MRCNHDRLVFGPDFATKCAECFIPASEIHTGRQWFKEVVIFGQGTRYGIAIANEPQYIKDAVNNDSGVVVGLRAWLRLSLCEHIPIMYNGNLCRGTATPMAPHVPSTIIMVHSPRIAAQIKAHREEEEAKARDELYREFKIAPPILRKFSRAEMVDNLSCAMTRADAVIAAKRITLKTGNPWPRMGWLRSELYCAIRPEITGDDR